MSYEILIEIADERRRQITVEGWQPHHDDKYLEGELALAAASYAWYAGLSETQRSCCPQPSPPFWPWALDAWKPGSRRRELIKAAALIVAEIERQDRDNSSQAHRGASPFPPEAHGAADDQGVNSQTLFAITRPTGGTFRHFAVEGNQDGILLFSLGDSVPPMTIILSRAQSIAFARVIAEFARRYGAIPHGEKPTDDAHGIPAFEQETCGTHYLIAERALRIIGHTPPFEPSPTAQDVEAIRNLCSEAGVAFAREQLTRDRAAPFDDNLPF